ncbi:hypothetical protein HUG17_10344 [Dermatophagoides farinae]|uniref:Uncharacterized protein n=1 Tax=Dermatophagoides farinae TaxID=6954 RepID=A0A9D4NPV7_DERFA|nr:hypothetical protein HUG17_10344 [Dermatophagoides farinae]
MFQFIYHQQLMKTFIFIIININSIILAISMTPEQYRQLIMNHCYNRTEYREPLILGQTKPIGMTIDYFVTLTEKLEQYYPQLDTKQMITLILKRFHYDGIRNLGHEEYFQQIRYPQMQQENEVFRRQMNEMLFQDRMAKMDSLPPFSEDVFTENEKCAMYFMMSHTVNKTAVDNYGNQVVKEFGIVSLMNDDNLAISLNYVLLGIAAALYDVPLLTFVNDRDQLEIDPLYAVTLSDKLAISALESIENYDSMFGSQGHWNSTYCQSEYLITDRNNRHVVTMSEINGGIDGWMIGNKLSSQKGRIFRTLKLSTIIDRYYSHDGLSIDCGICKVDFFPENFIDNLYRTARGYAFYWNRNFLHENFEYERIDGFVRTMTDIFRQFIVKSNTLKHAECSRISQYRKIDMQIETKSDLYIMIDNNAHEYYKYHLEAITKLLVKLKSLNSLGRITIMVNALQGYDSEHISNKGDDLRLSLHLLAYNTTSIQKATCRLAWYNYRETTINSKKTLLYNLMDFFQRDSIITDTMNGHSKNFLWFSLKSNSYEKLIERDRAYYYQYRWNLLYYLNIRMFFLSTFDQHIDDDLSQMVINKGDWFRVNAINYMDEITVDKLVQRIMQTPIPMRIDNNDCQQQKNGTTFDQKFLVGKNRKQYWVLYPKYFLNSRLIHFKFHSGFGRMRICLGRYLFPETNYTQCRESNINDEMIEFIIAHPCRWNVIETCLPIYFTVISKDDMNVNNVNNNNNQQPNKCYYLHSDGKFVEDVCTSRMDTIWTISVDGMTCTENNCKNVLPNYWNSLSLFIIVLIVMKFLSFL